MIHKCKQSIFHHQLGCIETCSSRLAPIIVLHDIKCRFSSEMPHLNENINFIC